ncbi:hypothetical protein OFN60_36620, partial [Escherichia coli]|nr:hypothetical protein [Escherichia coli]
FLMITTSGVSRLGFLAMNEPLKESATLAPAYAAAQHGPRPLTLFLDLLREQTEGDPARRAAVLAGLRAYQAAERSPHPPDMPVAAR